VRVARPTRPRGDRLAAARGGDRRGHRILLNITGGRNLGLFEVNEAAEIVQTAADRDANIIFGAVIDESQADEVSVTVIGTGFQHHGRGRVERAVPAKAIVAPGVLAATAKPRPGRYSR